MAQHSTLHSTAEISAAVRFICRFGNDSHAEMLQEQLAEAGVDISGCQRVAGLGSGQGIVMLEPDGAASSIVAGGANTAWGEVSAIDLDRGAGGWSPAVSSGMPDSRRNGRGSGRGHGAVLL
jgi:sugar/nucleoside kinase (ribokinase family)